MKNLRLLLLLASLNLFIPSASSQELSVEGFRLLLNDLTANTFGTIEYDQNGKPAALIKVVTTETGFVFDVGMLGIVKIIEQPGEIWVYVPYGLKHMTIAHPEFGILRDYYFPISIERARTYELSLRTVRPERAEVDMTPIVNVSFDNPADSAGVFLNGAFIGIGSWSGQVAASTYILEVKQEGFVTYSTTITIEADKSDHSFTIPPLEHVKGKIMANTIPENATVYLDGLQKGITPLLIDSLGIGTYNVEYRKRGFRPYTKAVTVKNEETYNADAILSRVNHNYYAGVGYQVGHASGITLFAGIYYWNFNIEIGYMKPMVSSERTYWITSPEAWSGTTSQCVYDFSLKDAFSGSVGYGIPIKSKLCITPNAGVVFYKMEGKCSYEDSDITAKSNSEDYIKASTYTLSGMISARVEYSPVKYVSLIASPSFEIPLNKGGLATTLDESTNIIEKWCNGFSVKAGVKLYF